MRSDMSKVIVERPRDGTRLKAPKGQTKLDKQTAWDDQPQRESISRKWHRKYGGKRPTDVLGPIYGWLLKQVGRPWNDVFSEICAQLKHTSTMQSHVRDHIDDDFVEQHVILVDGRPCYGGGTLYGTELSSYGQRDQLYVHPLNGLLCRVLKRRSRRRAQPRPAYIVVDATHQAHQFGGVWYLLTLRHVGEAQFNYAYTNALSWFAARHLCYDVARRRVLSSDDAKTLYGGPFVATAKRQLNKREIRKLLASKAVT